MVTCRVVNDSSRRHLYLGPAEVGILALMLLLALLCAAVRVSHRDTQEKLTERLSKLKHRFDVTQHQLPSGADTQVDRISKRQVTAGVVSQFIPYVQEDLDHKEIERASSELSQLEQMLERLEHAKSAVPEASITHRTRSPSGRRLKMNGSAIVASSQPQGDQNRETGPVFLTGYGAFKRVRDDVERMPAVGANLIQVEIGPLNVFPTADGVNRKPLDALVAVLDRAEKAGVAVDVLLSPHFFPTWMLERVPALRRHREGFVQFCTHHPAARNLLRRFIRTVVEVIRNHPALFSVCLANEPESIEEPCEPARQNWRVWLLERHNSVGEFNNAHGTKLRSLDEVPLPNPFDQPRDRALWADFIRFNQEQHAEWLGVLASAVHEVAPDLPVHVKALTPLFLGRTSKPAAGIDPTLLARLSGLNGNDAYNLFQYGRSVFAESWQENAMGHDLQKSLSPAPLFNSENHIIPDRESRNVPPSHVRAALWQAAVHGQAATTIWVWDRSFDHKSDFWGSILERPDDVEAVGLANIDLNRAAPELRVLQDAHSDVTVLSSTSALTWDIRVPEVTEALYTALSFHGVKIGFVTERQLEGGIGPATSTLFVPGNVHLSQLALQKLGGYRGRVVFVGSDQLLSRDDHDHPTTLKIQGEVLGADGDLSWRALWGDLTRVLPRWNVVSPLTIRDGQGKLVWGIEWRSALDPSGRWIINVCNYRNDAVTVELTLNGRPASGRDVLTGIRLTQTTALGSLETKLIRLD